jgi:invasion protein IalB
MIRPSSVAFRALACAGMVLSASLLTLPATARPASKPATGKPAAPGGGQQIGAFGDWGAYASQGRNKVCYALSQPKERLPKQLNRDPAYLFVSMRPADGVRNEVSWVLGFGAKDSADAEAVVDGTAFAVVTKGANGWVKDPAQEGPVVASMSKGEKLVLKVQSARGNKLSDEYSLRGFTQALERARKECS